MCGAFSVQLHTSLIFECLNIMTLITQMSTETELKLKKSMNSVSLNEKLDLQHGESSEKQNVVKHPLNRDV